MMKSIYKIKILNFEDFLKPRIEILTKRCIKMVDDIKKIDGNMIAEINIIICFNKKKLKNVTAIQLLIQF